MRVSRKLFILEKLSSKNVREQRAKIPKGTRKARRRYVAAKEEMAALGRPSPKGTFRMPGEIRTDRKLGKRMKGQVERELSRSNRRPSKSQLHRNISRAPYATKERIRHAAKDRITTMKTPYASTGTMSYDVPVRTRLRRLEELASAGEGPIGPIRKRVRADQKKAVQAVIKKNKARRAAAKAAAKSARLGKLLSTLKWLR